MPGEIASEQLPEIIEQSNQAIMGFDAYLRKILIELKSAPNTPAFQRLREVATNKLHLTEQWKIIYGNPDAWPRQKVYVAQAILGFLRQPNFEFMDAVRAISDQMSRGEAEAKQQTLAAATQVAMGMPYLFIQMSGAESMWKLVFGQDMFGNDLSGWERLEAAGDLALMAAMVYVPAKITSDLSAPKTTARAKTAGKAKAGGAAGRTPGAGEKTEFDLQSPKATTAPTELQEAKIPLAEQRDVNTGLRAEEVEMRIAEARAKGVDVDAIAEKHGIDAGRPVEGQIQDMPDIKQNLLTDALSEDLMKATQAKISEGIQKGEIIEVNDGEPDTDLIHKALIRQQAAERNPAEMALDDYKETAAFLRERMKDPKFREKMDRAVLRDADVGETSYRPLVDEAGRSMLRRMAGGERPIYTPAPTGETTVGMPVPGLGGAHLTQVEQKASLAAERKKAEAIRTDLKEAQDYLSETVTKLKKSEQDRYEGHGEPNAEQTEHELLQTGQRINAYIDKKERELRETNKRISAFEQAPVEVEVETNVLQPALPPAEVFTPRRPETPPEKAVEKPARRGVPLVAWVLGGVAAAAVIVVLGLWAGGVIPGTSNNGPTASDTTPSITESTLPTTETTVPTTQPTETTSTTAAPGTGAPVIPDGQVVFSGTGDFDGVLKAIAGNLDHENFGKLAGPAKIRAQLYADAKAILFDLPEMNAQDNGLETGVKVNLEEIDFAAAGTGTYAGYPNIGVQFVGAITYWTLEGDLTIGGDGHLPGGQPIIYHFLGARSDIAPQTIPAFLETFLSDFEAAMQKKDQTYLFDHLHPAVIQLYGEQRCRDSIAAQTADPSYHIDALGASGPAAWDYNPPAGTVPVDDVYSVAAEVTSVKTTAAALMHFGWKNGELYWFANLGSAGQ